MTEQITLDNLDDFATGATVLGTGGGGDPYIGTLMARQAIKKHGPVELLDPEDIPADELVVPSAMLGAPTVMVEKLPRGSESTDAFEALETYMGQEAYATMSIEAGGLNSTVPIAVAAELEIPLVDADGMGRAFPEVQMVTMTMGGISATPMSIADEKGNSVFLETQDNQWAEQFARTTSIEMGGSCMIATYAHTGAELREHAILNSMSLAREIGETIRTAKTDSADPVEELLKLTDGFELFEGKILDVERRTEGGFAVGEATIDGMQSYEGRSLQLDFQNENLVARDSERGVVASVPDLITVLDAETGDPITTEGLQYGHRVRVVGMPCAEQWRTDAGLDLVGPRYFDYDIDYKPIENLQS
ncbi:DUF917 domain-containing protein [Halorubrum ezzemoulense]|uniref:DUF917 domain-containing protein n=1 Tax=Halorubrum ezzemoulense TaxID=337243 RepID=UPI002330DE04|nr:DUF917 domain-containing protein [Halorubrum ezzemoulense]MDB2265332.1 DUF917 domain-containing protein [Halorubrum ezzemoulense]MDB9235460.1 DUF917 domain-containing protein [Halorubrum ezzemoulense]